MKRAASVIRTVGWWPRPRGTSAKDPPRHRRGMMIRCARCEEWTRIPTGDVWHSNSPAICGSCVLDDIIAATTGCPRPRLYGQEINRAKWTEGELPVWSNQGRSKESQQ